MTLIDSAIAGILTMSVAGNVDVTLTSVQGAADQARNQHFEFTGLLTGNINVFWPLGRNRFFSVKNSTTGNFTLTIAVVGTPGTTVVVPQGQRVELFSDGANIAPRFNAVDSLTLNNTLGRSSGGTAVFIGGTSGGSGNAQTVATTTPTLGSLTTQVIIGFIAGFTNTGAMTLAGPVGGAKNVFKRTPTGIAACTGGEIEAGDFVYVAYDGTQYQLISQAANAGAFTGGTLTSTSNMSGAAFNEANATIASAATVNIGAAAANYLYVSGTTTITAFDTIQAGTERTLEFQGALTLTHNATSLILPGAANITTAAGDTAIFRSEGAGNWRCVNYSRGPASAATTLAGTDAIAFLTAAGFAGNKSIGANGYYKLPGGLIVQWLATGTIPGTGTGSFNFPIAFPNNVYSVVVTAFGNAAGGADAALQGTPTLSGGVAINNSSNAQNCYVIAIGN